MKPSFKPLATALAAALQLAALAAVPLAWDVRPGQPAPVMFDRYHGETINITATLRGFGELPFAPGADVRLWYQTNGMGQAWWSAPATVQSNVLSATWSPDLDPGADRVSLFFGAPSNVYASAVLRLRHSPGFTPSELTLPVQRLDFAAVEIANAPYYTKAETESKITELAPVPGDYETVSYRAMRISLPGDEGHPGGVFSPYINGLAKSATDARNLTKPGQSLDPGKLTLNQREQEVGDGSVTGVWWPAFLDAWNAWHWVASEDYVDEAINNIDIPSPPDLTPYATQAALESESDLARARHDYRWAAKQGVLYRIDFDADGYQYLTPVTNVNALAEGNEHILIHLEEQRHGNAD